MKGALIFTALLIGAWQTQPAFAQEPRHLVDQAVAAEGGAAALRDLKAVAITADGKYWEPGQSLVAGGEPRVLKDSKLTISWDVANGVARTQWDRDRKYPFPVR
jgi:hypothetical protein